MCSFFFVLIADTITNDPITLPPPAPPPPLVYLHLAPTPPLAICCRCLWVMHISSSDNPFIFFPPVPPPPSRDMCSFMGEPSGSLRGPWEGPCRCSSQWQAWNHSDQIPLTQKEHLADSEAVFDTLI